MPVAGLIKCFAACILAILLLLPGESVSAHPADMYGQIQSITLSKAGIQVAWRIIPGPILADSIWQAAGPDASGAVSDAHAQAWIAPFVSDFSVQLGGRSFSKPEVLNLHWPASVDVLRTGEDAIAFTLQYPWPDSPAARETLAFHNVHFESNSLDSFSLTALDGLTFDQPSQNGGLLQTAFSFPVSSSSGQIGAASSPSALTSWSSGTPNLPDFTAALSHLAVSISSPSQANPASTPSAPAPGISTVTSALTGLVKAGQFSPLFLIGALLLSMALGTLHALTPGHGKALVGAYLVGSQGRTRDAVFLGTVVTATHTGSVLLLGLITLFAAHYVLPALIVPWLEVVSGVLVIAFGLNLLIRRGLDLVSWLAHRRAAERDQQLLEEHPHAHGADRHDHHSHTRGHEHVHPGDRAETRSHELQAGQVNLRSLLTLGISGGLVPCPDAIAILLVAVAVNRIPFGMLLIVSFSVGLALVLIGIGIAMVHGVRLIARSDVLARFALYTPVISAVAVSGLGLGLTWSAYNSLKFAAAVSHPSPLTSAAAAAPSAPAPSGFDLKAARLLYLAADPQGFDQLFMHPLGGGSPVQYTSAAGGITDYSVSPDRRLIAFTLFDGAGGSAIWAVQADGTHAHLLLACPQAECDAPRWYPDDQRLIYERLDESSSVTVPRFSVWWLDASTGSSRPVFQDQEFPSYAPAFSPDGTSLAYISTADNLLVIYNLEGGGSRSLPLGTQSVLLPIWSPHGEAVLFGSQSQDSSPVQLKLYDVASGGVTDLGAPAGATDVSAAWSPDGAWIAIDRTLPLATGQVSNQVWLVKPDGTAAHVLLAEAGASYSGLTWSPDGRDLIYSRYALPDPTDVRGRFDTYMTDVQAGTSQLLVAGADVPALLP